MSIRVSPVDLLVIEQLRDEFLCWEEEERAGRRRGRQKGYVRREGPSWFVTFREYRKNEAHEWADERVTEYLGPASMSLKEAERKARPFVERANRKAEKPSMTMLLSAFVEQQFRPMVLRTKKAGGIKHYRTMLDTHILPALGHLQLCDVGAAEVMVLINRLDRKYSRQTQLHVKNAVSAIFRMATDLELYERRNPAATVKIGQIVPEKRPSYNVEQLGQVLVRLQSPVYEMALLAAECSLGPAELCGIRLRHCNLTGQPVEMDGELIAPRSILVCENFYEGKRGTLKTAARRRVVPLGPAIAAKMVALAAAVKDKSPEAPLFQGSRGRSDSKETRPVDTHNVANRVFKPLTKSLGFPVTWYSFRRAHSSLAALTGASLADRKLVMGHSQTATTLFYDVQDVERMRGLTSRIDAAIDETCSKVVEIRKVVP